MKYQLVIRRGRPCSPIASLGKSYYRFHLICPSARDFGQRRQSLPIHPLDARSMTGFARRPLVRRPRCASSAALPGRNASLRDCLQACGDSSTKRSRHMAVIIGRQHPVLRRQLSSDLSWPAPFPAAMVVKKLSRTSRCLFMMTAMTYV